MADGTSSNSDLATHMKRYHPRGYNPDRDTCKFFPAESDVCLHKKQTSSDDSDYYTKKLHQMTLEESIRTIHRLTGARIEKADEFANRDFAAEHFLSDFGDKYKANAKQSTVEEHNLMCRMAATVLKDLNERFGFLPLIDYLVPAVLPSYMGGMTTPDHVNCEKNAVVLNTASMGVFTTDGNWGHKDSRLPFEVIAHEIGHVLTDEVALLDFPQQVMLPLCRKHPDKKIREIITQEFSGVAAESRWEAIADLFARVTSPSYRRGELPSECEEFVFTGMNWR